MQSSDTMSSESREDVYKGTIFRRMVRAYDYLFTTRLGERQSRSLGHSFFLAFVICSVCIFANWQTIKPQDTTNAASYHGCIALEIAVNRIVCGKLSHVVDDLPTGSVPSSNWSQWATPIRDIIRLKNDNKDLIKNPLLSWPARMTGSRDAYCQKVTLAYPHNENSLMLMENAVLHAYPAITLRSMGFALSTMRIAMVVLFVFFILYIGGSPVAAMLLGIICMFIVGLDSRYAGGALYYAYYPFFTPFLLMLVTLFGISLKARLHRRSVGALLGAFGIGLFAGLFLNMRTSYSPLIIAALIIYVAFAVRALHRETQSPRLHRLKRAATIVLSFAAGMFVFHLIFIRPIVRMPSPSKQIVYHSIFHPLVLALDTPPNALAQREGIQWSDARGIIIAQKVDKDATLKDFPRYEKLLASYYFGLWHKYPGEMLAIYRSKLHVAGRTVIEWFQSVNQQPSLQNGFTQTICILFVPLQALSSGMYFAVLFLILSVSGYLLGSRFLNDGIGFVLSTLALSGFLLLMEAALIKEEFNLKTQQALLACVCFCAVVFWQVAADALSAAIWFFLRRRSTRTSSLS